MANLSIAQYVRQDAVSKRLNELLGKRSPQFVTSLVSAVNANTMLANCKPESVLTAALTAASLDLPINQNLGFAYLIPYKALFSWRNALVITKPLTQQMFARAR